LNPGSFDAAIRPHPNPEIPLSVMVLVKAIVFGSTII